ncbi:MAG: hypothetical protein ACXWYS_03925 [Gaiellaceae bacterium]
MLATQLADEHRHLQAVLRVYDEVSYVRCSAAADPEGTYRVVASVVGLFAEVCAELLEVANESMGDLLLAGYGAEPQTFYAEAMRLLQLRMRSIGLAA